MRKIDPFHYGRIEKDEVNQQAVQNYFQLIDEAEAFYNAQIRQVVEQMGGGQDRATVICLSGPSAGWPVALPACGRRMKNVVQPGVSAVA